MANDRPERYTNLIHARVPQDGSRVVTDYRFFYDDPRRYGLTQDPSGIGVPTPAEVAAGVTPVNYAYVPGDVRRYGGDSTGAVAADSAFASAVAQAKQPNGAAITCPGTYRIASGIVLDADNLHIQGSGIGGTLLLAGANGINVIKVAGSSCSVRGVKIDGFDGVTSWTGVHGLVLAPVNETTGGPYHINNNTVIGLKIANCTEGVRFRPGPTVFDQMYFNTLIAIETVDCIRHLWFQTGGTNANRNVLLNFRGGDTASVSNTGLQIDDASGNQFYACEFEGMLNGTSPNATPIGFLLSAGTGSQNDSNKFFGGFAEACTIGFKNAANLTVLDGLSVANCTTPFVYTVVPFVMQGEAPSVLAQVIGPFTYQANNQIAGHENNTLSLNAGIQGIQFNSPQVPGADLHTLDDYAETPSFTPTVFGRTSAGTGTYTSQIGSATKIGNRVFFEVTVTWTAHTGTGDLAVGNLPYTAGSGTSPPCVVVPSSLTFANQLGAYVLAGSNSISLVSFATGGALAPVAMDNAATLQISGCFFV